MNKNYNESNIVTGDYWKNVELMKKAGRNDLIVLADFDRTLTKGFDDSGQKVSSGVPMRKIKELGDDCSRKIEEIYSEFKTIIKNNQFFGQERIDKLSGCLRRQMEVMIESGLNIGMLRKLVDENDLPFRSGIGDFVDYLEKNNIPLIIMSAAWGDIIKLHLEKQGLWRKNIYIVANNFKFNEKGQAVGIDGPIVHVTNKSQILLQDFSFYIDIKNKKSVLLLGDSLDDVGMVDGFDYDNLIKIGFLNENVEENLDIYKKVFDLILLGDPDMIEVNKLINDFHEKDN